jgi:hypothetical protein
MSDDSSSLKFSLNQRIIGSSYLIIKDLSIIVSSKSENNRFQLFQNHQKIENFHERINKVSKIIEMVFFLNSRKLRTLVIYQIRFF